ncbi:MAG TPA: glycosyltransferase family 2 protein [Gaiellaceae bacterium]|nr:glycosyltransferase family 2 protein [Gaiellaceae bacterium]
MSADVLGVIVLVCLGYLLLTNLTYVALVAVAAVENGIRRRETASEDYDVLEASRFTIPVSVIVAAYDEEAAIVSTVRSLLALDYPEHEVIVVNDGSNDGTMDRLRDAFALEPYEVFVRRVFTTEEVRAIYRSAERPSLIVVDKANGGKADALNAGLNVARFRYVCGVDADTVFDKEALLKGMRLVVQDPARIVGVTSHLTIARDPEQAMAAPQGRRPIDRRPFMAYQHLDYLRAFFNNRLAWSRLGFMLCSVGAFQIWRRDVLEEVGGYSRRFTCEDIELTFRVHERFLREGRDYEIQCLPDNVGTTEGPDTVRKLVSQRERWQRVIDETVWHNRKMWFNPRYRSVGLLGAPFYLVTEVLAPAIEVLAIVSLPVAIALGVFEPVIFVVLLAAIAFMNAALTACAILLDDLQSRTYRTRDLLRLLLLAPFDLVLYRPIIVWARLKGSWRFLRGDKAWHKFERNVRSA